MALASIFVSLAGVLFILAAFTLMFDGVGIPLVAAYFFIGAANLSFGML